MKVATHIPRAYDQCIGNDGTRLNSKTTQTIVMITKSVPLTGTTPVRQRTNATAQAIGTASQIKVKTIGYNESLYTYGSVVHARLRVCLYAT